MTDTATAPTDDEIRRVHEHECAAGGHRWEFIYVAESTDPVLLVCTHCSRNLKVGPA